MRKTIILLAIIHIALLASCSAAPHYILPAPSALAAGQSASFSGSGNEHAGNEAGTLAKEPIDTRPMIALTFDDGPSPHTDRILDLLERYGGQATFFVVGRNVEEWQDTVIRMVNMGSEAANHTWYHPRLTEISNHRIREELRTTSAVIERVIGVPPPRFFRPPFGSVNGRVANVSAELGYAVITWTLDTRDWEVRNADAVYNIIMNRAEENSVILMHDTHITTADAMERVIPALIARGYRLVTVSELLHSLYGELEPGKIYGTYVYP